MKKRSPIRPPSSLQIEYIALDQIRQATRNPRSHDVEGILESIQRFGFTAPLILNQTTGRIVAGHGRLEALHYAKRKGLPAPHRIQVRDDRWYVPVVTGISMLSDKDAEAYLLADNRLTELAQWSAKGLNAMLEEIRADNSWEGTGFTEKDLPPIENTVKSPKEDDDQNIETFGGATSITRGSVPVSFWKDRGYLVGSVLDFGCGKDVHEYAKYDAFHAPDIKPLLKSWDVIMCNYVLNVQPAEHLIIQLCLFMSRLLAADGKIVIAIRNDLKHSIVTPRGTQIVHTIDDWRLLLNRALSVDCVEKKRFYGFVCFPIIGQLLDSRDKDTDYSIDPLKPRPGRLAKST